MNAQLDNRLTSAMAVKKVGEKYNVIISAIPALKRALDDHNALIVKIQGKRPDSEKSTKGTTESKDTAKQQLGQLSVELTSALGAMASETNNEVLMAQCAYSASDFLYVRGGLLLDRSRLIYKLVLANKEILESDYSVTAEELEEMESLIDNFDDKDTAPLEVINERKEVNAELLLLYKELILLYKNRLDKLMKKQQTKQPALYKAYMNARNIINLGVRHEKDDENGTDDTNKTDDIKETKEETSKN